MSVIKAVGFTAGADMAAVLARPGWRNATARGPLCEWASRGVQIRRTMSAPAVSHGALDHDDITVTLVVDQDYHVNANRRASIT